MKIAAVGNKLRRIPPYSYSKVYQFRLVETAKRMLIGHQATLVYTGHEDGWNLAVGMAAKELGIPYLVCTVGKLVFTHPAFRQLHEDVLRGSYKPPKSFGHISASRWSQGARTRWMLHRCDLAAVFCEDGPKGQTHAAYAIRTAKEHLIPWTNFWDSHFYEV